MNLTAYIEANAKSHKPTDRCKSARVYATAETESDQVKFAFAIWAEGQEFEDTRKDLDRLWREFCGLFGLRYAPICNETGKAISEGAARRLGFVSLAAAEDACCADVIRSFVSETIWQGLRIVRYTAVPDQRFAVNTIAKRIRNSSIWSAAAMGKALDSRSTRKAVGFKDRRHLSDAVFEHLKTNEGRHFTIQEIAEAFGVDYNSAARALLFLFDPATAKKRDHLDDSALICGIVNKGVCKRVSRDPRRWPAAKDGKPNRFAYDRLAAEASGNHGEAEPLTKMILQIGVEAMSRNAITAKIQARAFGMQRARVLHAITAMIAAGQLIDTGEGVKASNFPFDAERLAADLAAAKARRNRAKQAPQIEDDPQVDEPAEPIEIGSPGPAPITTEIKVTRITDASAALAEFDPDLPWKASAPTDANEDEEKPISAAMAALLDF